MGVMDWILLGLVAFWLGFVLLRRKKRGCSGCDGTGCGQCGGCH